MSHSDRRERPTVRARFTSRFGSQRFWMYAGTLSCGLWCCAVALADTALSATQIAERAVRTDALNWAGGRTRVRMVLTEVDGKQRERTFEVVGRKKNGLHQALLRVLAPAETAGTAFLMLEHGKDESEQYIYLPAMKRTRRIAGRDRDGSFMGSDFTYADLQGLDTKDATHTRLSDEKIGNDQCYVVESTMNPNAPSAYGKLVTWVRQSDFIALRTKLYDHAGKLSKTLYSRRVKNIDGAAVVVEARMQSGQTTHATDFFVDSVERHDNLADDQFTPAALEHP